MNVRINDITDKLALIQSTVNLVMDNNDTPNGLTRTVEFLSSKLELTTTELNSIKRENAELKVSHTQLMHEIGNLTKRTDHLEAQSRRNYLLFEGIEEIKW